LNRARDFPLTRACGAASPASKRARRIIGGAERDILTWSLTFDPLPSGEGKKIRDSSFALNDAGHRPWSRKVVLNISRLFLTKVPTAARNLKLLVSSPDYFRNRNDLSGTSSVRNTSRQSGSLTGGSKTWELVADSSIPSW